MNSIWSKTCEIDKYPLLDCNIEADVAVIGGGMAGILIAWQLERAGVHAVVLEANRIGSGQTKNTTAKITSQHGMFCDAFIKIFGEKNAKKYVQANEEAIREYKRIIKEEEIDCDFRESDSFVYSEDEEKLKREVEAARQLGIEATFEVNIEIPISCAGAVRFPNQAEFHPLKFIKALAKRLTIFEDTKVIGFEDSLVKTTCGSVTAKKVVFATHYPFINFPGMYFTRMHQERSYVLALENAGIINGMYIGEGKEPLSFRQYGDYILLGGQEHRTGEKPEGGCYENLKKEAEKLYPGSNVVASWSAQDCVTIDNVPFIGQYADSKPDWYVATGFKKWGMTSSMVSAIILRDMIIGIRNPYEEVFSPSRFKWEEVPNLMVEGGKAVKGLVKRFLHLPDETVNSIKRGEGAIVSNRNGRVGVYKTEDNEIHQVDIVCSHMGCEVSWNPEEKTWDCPCHGSRYDYEGNLIDGPAQKGIQCERGIK